MNKLYYEAKWFTIILFFVAGAFFGALGLFTFVFNGGQIYGLQKVHPPKDPNYPFINPLLAIADEGGQNFLTNLSLENKLNAAAGFSRNPDLVNSGFYFRDIEDGRWVEISASHTFTPGRFLKMPLMIAFFKQAETDPQILDRMIVYTGTSTPELQADGVVLPEAGQAYSISGLIRESVLADDNHTAEILLNVVDKKELASIYSELGMNFLEETNAADHISIKQYTLFFRVLYDATYLSRKMSNAALTLLSDTPRTIGFAASLPNDIPIAHRYHTQKLPDGKVEISDCGIIYYPDHPYELCISLTGPDQQTTDRAIDAMSQVIYQDMKNRHVST